MKINKTRLIQIIEEEYAAILQEDTVNQLEEAVSQQTGNALFRVASQLAAINAAYKKIDNVIKSGQTQESAKLIPKLVRLAQGLVAVLGGTATGQELPPAASNKPTPATISLGTNHAKRMGVVGEGALTQSEVAMAMIETSISNTLETILADVVTPAEIASMLDNAKNAVQNRIGDDLSRIYDEPSTTMMEVVMTQEPADIIEELKALIDQLSSSTDREKPLRDITLKIADQISDLEEIITMEKE
jgi:hypothetical protein|tara:strand:+ start:9593 stop:10327 length:735 start_codon:yes stop_codon:yes gene_type:complete